MSGAGRGWHPGSHLYMVCLFVRSLVVRRTTIRRDLERALSPLLRRAGAEPQHEYPVEGPPLGGRRRSPPESGSTADTAGTSAPSAVPEQAYPSEPVAVSFARRRVGGRRYSRIAALDETGDRRQSLRPSCRVAASRPPSRGRKKAVMGVWITIDPYWDPIAAFETEEEAKASIGRPRYYENATWHNWFDEAWVQVKPWDVELG